MKSKRKENKKWEFPIEAEMRKILNRMIDDVEKGGLKCDYKKGIETVMKDEKEKEQHENTRRIQSV